MVLIADCGSTKIDWCVLNGDKLEKRFFSTGVNALLMPEEKIRETFEKELAPEVKDFSIDEVYYYGAGCLSDEICSNVSRSIAACVPGAKTISVNSDLLAAARALCGTEPGIACILGTGSNSCLCRDGEILKNVPPLGYVLGDEGSGAVLGRNLVNGIFKGHIPLKEEFLAAHGLNYEEIIRRVYREPYANRFLASFAPFIRAHIDRPEIRELVLRSFRDFASRNLSRYPAELPVSLLGGVAAHFEALLREALEAEGRRVETIVESPAEGLLKYHYGR